MQFMDTANEIQEKLKDEHIAHTDNQLLYVQWNICYQLAKLNDTLADIKKIAVEANQR